MQQNQNIEIRTIDATSSKRNDLQLIRGLSIVAVVLYHLEIFAYGYLGVDAFIILSGFLIGNKILSHTKKNTPWLRMFIFKRFVRLTPPLIIVSFGVSLCNWIFMPTSLFQQTAFTIFLANIFSSNIQFWRTVDYFDDAANFNLFIHTWSLSLEFQFYIFIAIFSFLISKIHIKSLIPLCIVGTFFSIGLWSYFLKSNPLPTFYLFPFRAWEFLLGLLIAHELTKKEKDNFYGNKIGSLLIITILGVTILFSPVLSIVLMGMIFVLARGFQTKNTFWKASKLIFLGNISYSLYLVHFPLLFYFRIFYGDPIENLLVLLSYLVLLLTISFVTYYYFELKIFHHLIKNGSPNFFIIYTGIVVLLFILGGVSANTSQPDLHNADNPSHSTLSIDDAYKKGKCFIPRSHFTGDFNECFNQNLTILGDSHAAALASGFRHLRHDVGQLTMASCIPLLTGQQLVEACSNFNELISRKISSAETLVIHAHWKGYINSLGAFERAFGEFIDKGNSKIVLVGSTPTFAIKLADLVIMKDQDLEVNPRIAVDLDPFRKLDQRLMNICERSTKCTYISAVDALCNNIGCLARVMEGSRAHVAYYDDGHLKPQAASVVAKEILRLNQPDRHGAN